MNSDFPILTSSRLILRQPQLTDAPEIKYLRSDSVVNAFVKRPLATTIAEAEAFINRVRNEFEIGKSVSWGICLKDADKLIGTISLWNYSDDLLKAEIGYDLSETYHNKGLMAEAIEAVTQYGFNTLNFKIIEAFTSKYNKASLRLLEKLQFQLYPELKDEDNLDNLIFKKLHQVTA